MHQGGGGSRPILWFSPIVHRAPGDGSKLVLGVCSHHTPCSRVSCRLIWLVCPHRMMFISTRRHHFIIKASFQFFFRGCQHLRVYTPAWGSVPPPALGPILLAWGLCLSGLRACSTLCLNMSCMKLPTRTDTKSHKCLLVMAVMMMMMFYVL